MVGFSNVARLDDFRQPGAGMGVAPDQIDAIEIPQPDGGVIIQFLPSAYSPGTGNNDETDVESDFHENLAEHIDGSELARISYDLLDGIESDERSRAQWVSDRVRGLDLLAVKVEQPRADIGGSGAPMDGMSQVRHPLLLEACIKFQSNAKRELLPAAGPVKIQNVGRGTIANDARADKFGNLMNQVYTQHMPEYYPDTDRMFFDQGFGGMGFKKCFHCPLRRRPASDAVPSKDFIVSNDATDLRTAQRVTHRLTMTRAIMARMMYVGAYAKVDLQAPDMTPPDQVKEKIANVAGVTARPTRQQDQEYTIYECYTFLDIAGFEHTDDSGEATGLPLPYKVTIDKTSRQVLEVRRDWEEDNSDTFERRVTFIAYNFVPMFGFYASGLLHILGNATAAVTAAWRIMLDNGMFSNFPGFLYAKSGGRQTDLNFRVPPGGGAGVDIAGAEDIRKTVMPLPYNTQNAAALMQLTDNIVGAGSSVGGMAEFIDASGMKQNVPVGTMMAAVEQAAQMISAVHERMFVSQSQELQTMLRLFREDPESLWRMVEKEGAWTKDELEEALFTYGLVPVADPNTPTHIHRIMKMTALKDLQSRTPEIYDVRKVDETILRSLKFDDPEMFFVPPQPQAQPSDPAVIIAQMTAAVKNAEIASRERIETQKMQLTAHKTTQDNEVKTRIAQDNNEVKLAVAEIAADAKDKDRASSEHIEEFRGSLQQRLSPFANHDKVLEAKKTAPPRPTNGPKKN